MELNREQALDVLDKMDFFQGQRAGRKLWNSKPYDVQEQDIANFSRDVALLKNYIKELTEANDKLSNLCLTKNVTIFELSKQMEGLAEENEAWQKKLISQEEKAGKAYYDLACEVEDLRSENERLREACNKDISFVRVSRGSGKTNHLREVARLRMDAVRADTVRKMQERITEHSTNGYPRKVRLDVIEKIAKEMMEEGNNV